MVSHTKILMKSDLPFIGFVSHVILFAFCKWRNLSPKIQFVTQIISENKVYLSFMREGVKPSFVVFC